MKNKLDNKFEVTFLGTSGSCAYNNGNRGKYGINTSCVAVRAGSEVMIFDAGSGICGFTGLSGYQTDHLHVFFSHFHIDHVNGLLFFPPLFDSKKKISLYGCGSNKYSFTDIMYKFLSPPLHPIGVSDFKADCDFNELKVNTPVVLSDEVTICTFSLSHPGGSMGYRVEYGGKAMCYCTDIELAMHENDPGLLAFTSNADLLIIDTFFSDEGIIPGWGHSNWRESAQWAKFAGVKKLALFHYNFSFFDSDIDDMEREAKKIFPNTFASADLLRVEL